MATCQAIILAIILWIPFLLFGALLAPGFLLLMIYRLLVTRALRKFLRPDLVEPITGLDVGFSTDAFWTAPKGGIAFVHCLSGPVEPDVIQARISQILDTKNADYKRLTSLYPVTWLGYPFWKLVPQGGFQLPDHIRIIHMGPPEIQSDFLENMVSEWVRSPFKIDAPLWDILLVQNGTRSMFGFRIHHMVGDGFSMLQFLDQLFDTPTIPAQPSQAVKVSSCSISTILFWTPKVTFDFLRAFYRHSDPFTAKKRTQDISLTTTSIPLQELKKAGQNVGQELGIKISVVALVMHLFGTSMKRYLVHDLRHQPEQLPNHIFIVASLTLHYPAHPQRTFCNHWTHGVYSVPIREPNSLNRLKELQAGIDAQTECQAGRISHNISEFCSLMPRFVHRTLISEVNMGTPFGLANLAGPTTIKHLCGQVIERKYAVVGLQWEHASIGIGMFSYNGDVTITMMANQDVIPNMEKAKKVLNEYLQDAMSQILAEQRYDSV